MRLLILTPQFPYPPHQGTTLRNYNIIKNLAQRHSIDLFSLLVPGDDPASGPVSGLAERMLTAPQPQRATSERLRDLVLSPLPDMALRLWDEDAYAQLAAHVEANEFDILQVEGIEMAPYLLRLRAAGFALPPVIFDAHNAETLLQKRAFQADLRRPRRWAAAGYSVVQTAKLERYERRILQAAAGVSAVSDADAAEIRRLAPDCTLELVPNGVDMDAYAPDALYPDPYQRSGPNLVFTGKMDYRPNVDGVLWFAERVLPQLHATNLDPHFWIVGKNPHTRLNALRTRPDVTITGAVPDIQPYIAHADLYVAPLLAGGGTRLKILEAMAMAKPILSTRLGADGFPVRDGKELALADDPNDFAARAAQLLQDPEAATALGRRGLNFAREYYDWRSIVPRLDRLFGRVVG